MTWRRIGLILLLLPVIAVGGLFVLLAGMKGASNFAESICIEGFDGRLAYGGYSMSAEI